MKLRNRSPYGDLDIPLVRRVVQGGTTFDVTEEQARMLLAQTENYEPADDEARAVADDVAAEQEAAESGDTPAVSAKKAAWVGWAAAHGADPEEAEAMTKDQLIEQYGPKGDDQ